MFLHDPELSRLLHQEHTEQLARDMQTPNASAERPARLLWTLSWLSERARVAPHARHRPAHLHEQR
jgi:hypothetical protein